MLFRCHFGPCICRTGWKHFFPRYSTIRISRIRYLIEIFKWLNLWSLRSKTWYTKSNRMWLVVSVWGMGLDSVAVWVQCELRRGSGFGGIWSVNKSSFTHNYEQPNLWQRQNDHSCKILDHLPSGSPSGVWYVCFYDLGVVWVPKSTSFNKCSHEDHHVFKGNSNVRIGFSTIIFETLPDVLCILDMLNEKMHWSQTVS